MSESTMSPDAELLVKRLREHLEELAGEIADLRDKAHEHSLRADALNKQHVRLRLVLHSFERDLAPASPRAASATFIEQEDA